VDATPGLTRDRLYGEMQWRGKCFRVIDTGGLTFSGPKTISGGIHSQVIKAVEEADLCLLVCDGKSGPLPLDREVADWARRWGKPVLVVVNKIDNDKTLASIYEFSALGLGDPLAISSLHGIRIGELLDEIFQQFKDGGAPSQEASSQQAPATAQQARSLRVAIVGRPNVGKSSLLNRLLNEDRVLVDELPGTTRDPVETILDYRQQRYALIDTAGIRSKRNLKNAMDAVARLKAQRMIRSADVCLGVLEASRGLIKDDLKLLDLVITSGRPLCLALNKWDLLPQEVSLEGVAAEIYRRAPFLRFASIIATSAKTGFQVLGALEASKAAADEGRRKITTAQARHLLEVVRKDPSAPVGVRNAHFIRFSQASIAPPVFHLLVRVKRSFRASDVMFLEKVFRRELGFQGTPIRLHLLVKRR